MKYFCLIRKHDEFQNAYQIHRFLINLTNLEVEIGKSHINFVHINKTIYFKKHFQTQEHWDILSQKTQISRETLIDFSNEIFQKNKRQYPWSKEDDCLLKDIIQ